MTRNSLLTRILPTLAAVAFTALFTALGFWQLGRADFKNQIWRDFQRSKDAEAQAVTSLAELEGLARYTPVRLTGRFDSDHQVLLDNRIRAGRVGVHVYTPLLLDGGAVLVNRGWRPMPPDRRSLPEAPAPAGTATVSGRVSPPPATGLELGEAGRPEDWPWLTPYLHPGDLAPVLGVPVASSVILLDPVSPHGFVREWEPATLPPERHTGYAVQWFALALAVIVVWAALTWRAARWKRRDHEVES